MSKLTLVPSLNRGAPRTNKRDARGQVRVSITLPTSEGNISRTFSVANATVTEVLNALTATCAKPKTTKAAA